MVDDAVANGNPREYDKERNKAKTILFSRTPPWRERKDKDVCPNPMSPEKGKEKK